MKKRNLAALFLAASLATAAMTGCGSSEEETTAAETQVETEASTSVETDAETEAETSEETEAETETTEETVAEESDTETQVDETLANVLDEIKAAYGENYIPNMELDPQLLEDIVGLTPDHYEVCLAETPMISNFVETFIGVKAAEGKADEVETILTDYRDKLLNDTLQYPMSIPKIEASQVVRHGDYVFYIMLGSADDEALEAGDEAALESAKKNNQIAVDIVNKTFE